MSLHDLMKRLAEVGATERTEPTPPPIESVAFSVRWERGLRNWKVSTLASFAGVSVSTVERVERGEEVSVESLDRIAVAFGYEAGRYTAPRLRLPREEAAQKLLEVWGDLEPVEVRPLNCQAAVRQLAQCHAVLFQTFGVPDEHQDDVRSLLEWLDLASMMLSEGLNDGKMSDGRRRDLYADILQAASDLDRLGLAVLGGVMPAPQDGMDDWKVAVICVSTKAQDPGAAKRKHVFVDRRAVTGPTGGWWDDAIEV